MMQKALEEQELLRSQILALKKSNKAKYEEITKALKVLEEECGSEVWKDAEKPVDCENNLFIGLREKLN